MADLLATRLSTLVFSTSSDDYSAEVILPDQSRRVRTAGEPLPVSEVGLYELVVGDNGGKPLSVTVTGGTPDPVTRKHDHHVKLTYQIEY